MRKSREDRLNPCTRAVLTAKALETLQKTSHSSEVGSYGQTKQTEPIHIESTPKSTFQE